MGKSLQNSNLDLAGHWTQEIDVLRSELGYERGLPSAGDLQRTALDGEVRAIGAKSSGRCKEVNLGGVGRYWFKV